MFNNHNKKMFALAGKSVNKYGLDQTKKIIYNFDVSGTHWGPITHNKFAKLLWQLLK